MALRALRLISALFAVVISLAGAPAVRAASPRNAAAVLAHDGVNTAALPTHTVLLRYASALAAVRHPAALSFDYAVEQLGLRNMEQTHRVYRSGRSERDETLIVDGYALAAPSIRIINNRTNRYDIAAVAPRLGAYRFVFSGAIVRGSAYVYVFKTIPLGPAAFAVTEIEIDGDRFLPTTIRFKLAGADTRGSGSLAYESFGGYWVVRDAVVDAHLTSGATAHEHIAWSDYSFPPSLPASTFEAPRARLVDPAIEPVATPTPEPPSGP